MSVMKAKPKPSVKKKPATKPLPSVFTVRDMNRNTATVLEACRQNGRIIVRHRSGEEFQMVPVQEATSSSTETPQQRKRAAIERMQAHRERIRKMGVRGPTTPEGIDRLNQIIAGER